MPARRSAAAGRNRRESSVAALLVWNRARRGRRRGPTHAMQRRSGRCRVCCRPMPAQPQTDAIVLLSGGLDSATALAMTKAAGRRCHALSFRYGQRHAVELRAAAAVARSLGAVSSRVVDIDLRGIGGSALTDDIEVPKD